MLKDHAATTLSGCCRQKSEPIFVLLGDLDELNAALGLARTSSRQKSIRNLLIGYQKDLITLSSFIAGVKISNLQEKITFLENQIKKLQNKKIKHFILPGRNKISAYLHSCRAICRRAERAAVSSHADHFVIDYLNNLSLILFWLAVKEEM